MSDEVAIKDGDAVRLLPHLVSATASVSDMHALWRTGSGVGVGCGVLTPSQQARVSAGRDNDSEAAASYVCRFV